MIGCNVRMLVPLLDLYEAIERVANGQRKYPTLNKEGVKPIFGSRKLGESLFLDLDANK